MNTQFNRRQFIGTTAAAGVGLSFASAFGARAEGPAPISKPAICGGNPAHPGSWPTWPVFGEPEEQRLLESLRSGEWFRYYKNAVQVKSFEDAYAQRAGAKYCVATSSGTSALYTSLGALDIGPGDEVILTPYTFVATYNVIVLNYALPIFVDVDLETFQLDPGKLEAAITENTRAIIPVHIGGNVADMDRIVEIADRHRIPVIEDACQAHLSEWRHKMVGNWGRCGCFSFQASKNLNCGEGGAILTNDAEFAHRCELFQDQGRARKTAAGNADDFAYSGNRGTNMRMSEWQGAILRAQMTRLEEQSDRRWQNAQYLSKLLCEIPGIAPARLYDGCTRSAYHLYMFRYDKEHFDGLPHDKFIGALNREGVPSGGGYSQLNSDKYVTSLPNNRHYQKLYGKEALDRWHKQAHCPQNDKLCAQSVWLAQTMLLGSRTDMDQIAEAIRKIQAHPGDVAKA
ncbi:MAG TPA: DegT/DnrJ/EryC1/StrS family aminotransferase [Candidatus Acidoferrum sp.]|nr:DegT/DnrJ/EryC1/StrS family aminotransferase [Candidatus Acidoferrum sp.]